MIIIMDIMGEMVEKHQVDPDLGAISVETTVGMEEDMAVDMEVVTEEEMTDIMTIM